MKSKINFKIPSKEDYDNANFTYWLSDEAGQMPPPVGILEKFLIKAKHRRSANMSAGIITELVFAKTKKKKK